MKKMKVSRQLAKNPVYLLLIKSHLSCLKTRYIPMVICVLPIQNEHTHRYFSFGKFYWGSNSSHVRVQAYCTLRAWTTTAYVLIFFNTWTVWPNFSLTNFLDQTLISLVQLLSDFNNISKILSKLYPVSDEVSIFFPYVSILVTNIFVILMYTSLIFINIFVIQHRYP